MIEVQGGSFDSRSSRGLALKPGMITGRTILGSSLLTAATTHVRSMVLLLATREFRATIVCWLSKARKHIISSAWACKQSSADATGGRGCWF